MDEDGIHEILGYEKIAAGEVIDRPSSVVKELLENAIDAGSTRVEVHVEAAGKKLIKVIDDGRGILPGEVTFAFEKHTTSKINDFQDVYKLNTLGFRGEALASIKTVARVEVITKRRERKLARKVTFEGDELIDESDVAAPDGTTIIVKNLFYNIPVRRKFLKKDAVEFAHISDIVTRYALAYHELDIKLFHNGRKVLDAPSSGGNLLNTIVSIYGREHATSMLPISGKSKTFSISGFAALPSITRSSRTYSSFFVNKRFIYSIDIMKAIENAYHGRIMKHRYPFFVLFLEIQPDLIDVNIHPSKKEIKFVNEEVLLRQIKQWIREALDASVERITVDEGQVMHLDEYKVGDGLDAGSPGQEKAAGSNMESPAMRDHAATGEPKFDKLITTATKRVQSHLLDDTSPRDKKRPGTSQDRAGTTGKARISGWKPLIQSEPREEIMDSGSFKVLPAVKTLLKSIQLKRTFLFFESNDNSGDLIIVDQHAASERVQYEKIKKKLETRGISSQELLIPKPLDLPSHLLPLLKENLDTLQYFGFVIEIVNEGSAESKDNEITFKLVKFPFIFHRQVKISVIQDFLEEVLSLEDKTLENQREEIINSLACHTAIRSGDVLTQRQIWNLLRELDSCRDPYHCVHGRPTFIVKKFSWLEREFKRIV
ncbi:MAG: DNA mismatch repair endonuclease MutL [Promethearchaeota archaeon]